MYIRTKTLCWICNLYFNRVILELKASINHTFENEHDLTHNLNGQSRKSHAARHPVPFRAFSWLKQPVIYHRGTMCPRRVLKRCGRGLGPQNPRQTVA